MKSLTGKFTSVRGWALLLALALSAGMMISACGDEEVPAPTAPAPTPTPTPTPPAPEPTPEPTGPATPENLRVSAATPDSITWTWDPAEGALGYQGQFSPDNAFTDSDPTWIIVAPQTSHKVENLSGNMTGHFRVRSGTGTALTDLSYSDWSDGVSGTTDARRRRSRLTLRATSRLRIRRTIRSSWSGTRWTTRTPTRWSSAWTARPPGATRRAAMATTKWRTRQCVASDLDEGTDYEFRVRGLPADDDTANTTGAWAETDGTTTGRAAVVTTSGGMGDLNVRWTSDSDGIESTWDRLAGKTYDYMVVTTDLPRMDSANPCPDVPPTPPGSQLPRTP